MENVVNIAGYKFSTLTDLKPLRESLIQDCKAWGLKGTILLSTEGINLFVAGGKEEIQFLLKKLRSISGLEDLTPKVSFSREQPFTRMLVRIKKEIISFGVEGIEPGKRTSPKLTPQELKLWLDEGRPVTLLDTRNDYEIKLGTFKNAHILGINHFRHFPEAVQKLPESMKETPIVMFCTGGIRCEKAGPYMEREGFKNIFQLEGGILKYFEEVGADHYDGECFVFDKRVGLDPNLQETENTLCFICLTPLTPLEQKDERYVFAESCPFCFKSTEEQMRERIASRQKKIEEISNPLPGSDPYQNLKPVHVPLSLDGKTFLDFISGVFPHVEREEWKKLVVSGAFLSEAHEPVFIDQKVRSGERYFHLLPEKAEPEVNPNIQIIYEDEAVVVVNKPAPLPMHPCGRFNRNTLQFILNRAYHPQFVHIAHRLDANTTGLVVLARTKYFAGILQPQFSRGEIEKIYLARVQGHPPQDTFSFDLPISDLPGVLGSRVLDEEGLPARTDFKVIERNPDGTALLEVKPQTGRTNQIRVHLWALGWPICGDQTYLLNQKLGSTQTHAVSDPPLQLHAYILSFIHPRTKEKIEFKTPPTW